MSAPLLMTKLFMPPSGKYLVERRGLVDRLNQCLDPGCRLALISAPAGFGKTTLISTWAAAAKANLPDLRIAWFSIDDGDNDPVVFWSYVISALQTQQPGVGQQALNGLATQVSNLEGNLASLVNDLVQIPCPCVIVLDDYHLIRNPLIQQSLSFFVEHLPPHVHLLLASRTDPPLPLALLRGRGQLIEFRLSDLRFSDDDAAAYLNAGLGLKLAAQSVETLNHKTEGWIAGLQMAALSLQGAPGAQNWSQMDDFVASFSGSDRYILDYLIEEVLNRQPEHIQRFLIQTSILDRLCGPLCGALLQEGAPAAQSILAYLESCNLFILPLDNQRYWYRYHQLFADLLKKRLAETAPGMVKELHRRAMLWYEQNGFIPQAIEHAFLLKDFHQAAALVSQITEELWGRGEHATLLAWMDALPENEKSAYPHLLVFQVSMLISAGKLQEAEKCIPVLRSYIREASDSDTQPTALIGSLSALETYIASFYGDQPALIRHATLALENLVRDEDAGKRSGVALVLGNAYLTLGDLESAGQTLMRATADAKKANKPHMILTGIANLSIVLWVQGRLKQAAQVCQEGLWLIQQNGLDRSPTVADLWIAWGEILCERGKIEEAKKYTLQGLTLAREQHFIWQMAWGYLAQAHLLLVQGNLKDAETALRAAEQMANEHEIPAHFACRAAGLQARIWVLEGKIEQAAQFLQGRGIRVNDDPLFPHEWEYLALARLCWARGDLNASAELLGRIFHGVEANKLTGGMISTLILQALLEQSQGHLEQAMQYLSHALALSAPEDYVQTFVDEGEPMMALLTQAIQHNISPEYAGRLLASFPSPQLGGLSGARPATATAQHSPVSAHPDPLIEPLSPREMELLGWIAAGYSNKEIAQKMYLSLRTVKYYSTNLYNKLGVDGRMQAVIRARELGLL